MSRKVNHFQAKVFLRKTFAWNSFFISIVAHRFFSLCAALNTQDGNKFDFFRKQITKGALPLALIILTEGANRG